MPDGFATLSLMTSTLERTVLFADLRGSTALYESLGNREATAVVTQSVDLLAQVVTSRGGAVVKTLGDGLMAMFDQPQAAIRAAHEMQDSLEQIPRPSAKLIVDPAVPVLRLQAGVAHGEVVEMAGDVFGDAVNIAARLLDHAGDNETLVTAEVVEHLSRRDGAYFRDLGPIQLRGRVEPVHVFRVEPERIGDTAVTVFGDPMAFIEPEGIRLTWLEHACVFSSQRMPIVLGRSASATYCIDDSRVSRSHARIDWHGGTFQLTDLSYNGSFVRFSFDEALISLRRGTCTLHGSGVIGLGTASLDRSAPCVRFEVMRFSATTPQLLAQN